MAVEDSLHPTLTLTTSYTGQLLENVSISNSSIFDKKKRFPPTSHSKRRKSPAVKALRPVRGALNLSLTSHLSRNQAVSVLLILDYIFGFFRIWPNYFFGFFHFSTNYLFG